MARKKATISTSPNSAIRFTKLQRSDQCLVYIVCANRSLKYRDGDSRILYIGTTAKGIDRMSKSASALTQKFFAHHGVTKVYVHPIYTKPRQKKRMWVVLERALLLRFREMYGEPPKHNTQGKKLRWRDEADYFTLSRLTGIIDRYSKDGRKRSHR